MHERFLEFANLDHDENFCIKVVKRYPEAFEYCKIQTRRLCEIAIKVRSCNLKHVKNQTEDLCILACKNNAACIEHIRNLTDDLIDKLIDANPYILEYVEQTDERRERVMRKTGRPMPFFNNLTEEMKVEILKNDNSYIKEIENPSEDLMRLSLEIRAQNIMFRKDWPLELYSDVIKNKPKMIGYIDEPPLEIQELVMELDPSLFDRIRKPFPQIVEKAVELKVLESVRKIKNPSFEACQMAFEYCPTEIIYIPEKYQTVEMWEKVIDYDVSYLLAHPTIGLSEDDFGYEEIYLPKNYVVKNETPPQHLVEKAVKANREIFKALPRQSDELCLECIRIDPYAVIHIPDPTKEMWELAISMEPTIALVYADASEDQIMKGLRKDPEFIRMLKNPTLEMWKYAVKRERFVARFPSAPAEILEDCLRKDPYFLRHVPQTDKNIRLALDLNRQVTLSIIDCPIMKRKYLAYQ